MRLKDEYIFTYTLQLTSACERALIKAFSVVVVVVWDRERERDSAINVRKWYAFKFSKINHVTSQFSN